MGGVERGFSALGSCVVARLEANEKLYHQDGRSSGFLLACKRGREGKQKGLSPVLSVRDRS